MPSDHQSSLDPQASATVRTERFAQETVRQCVERLGEPPADIAQMWREDARRLGIAGDDNPLPWDDPIWEQTRISSEGFLERVSVEPDLNVTPDRAYSESEQNRQATEQADSRTRASLTRWQRFLWPALGASLLLGVVYVLIQNQQPKQLAQSNPDTAPSRPGPVSSVATNAFSPGRISEEPVLDTDEFLELTTAESVDDGALSSNRPSTDPLSDSFSLDAFMPPSLGVPANQNPSDENVSSRMPVDVDGSGAVKESNGDGVAATALDVAMPASAGSPLGDGEVADVMAEDDTGDVENDAELQSTQTQQPRRANRFAAKLPPLPKKGGDQSEEVPLVTLPGPIDSLELDFPIDVEMTIQPIAGQAGNWHVVAQEDETTSSVPIARLRARSESGEGSDLNFAWLPAAGQLRPASQLRHGRIRTGGQDVLFLRPELSTETVRLSLDRRDSRLAWDLGLAIAPPPTTQLSFDLVVPKEVESQWLEAPDTAAVRKMRAIAVLTLKKTKEVSLVVRMDLSTNRAFSLRLRYGARLDPSMPWQWTDAGSVRTAFENVTQQLEAIDNQILLLDQAIARAEKLRARRQELVLEQRRDQAEMLVEQWAEIAKRLAQLDQLIAFVQAGAYIQAAVTVDWPNDSQTILATVDPDVEDDD